MSRKPEADRMMKRLSEKTPRPMVYQGLREFACVLIGWMWRNRLVKVVCERPRSELGSGFRKTERQTFFGRSMMFWNMSPSQTLRNVPGATAAAVSISTSPDGAREQRYQGRGRGAGPASTVP